MGYKKSIEKTIEVTGIELTCEKKKIIIIALYRPPSGGIHEFTQLIDVLENIVQKDQYIIIAADLNINIQQDGSTYTSPIYTHNRN
jgi:hypothetical protein